MHIKSLEQCWTYNKWSKTVSCHYNRSSAWHTAGALVTVCVEEVTPKLSWRTNRSWPGGAGVGTGRSGGREHQESEEQMAKPWGRRSGNHHTWHHWDRWGKSHTPRSRKQLSGFHFILSAKGRKKTAWSVVCFGTVTELLKVLWIKANAYN